MTARPNDRFSLKALRDHTGGNVLAIAAASVLPLLAIVGGTVDMSRAYMAQAQLQSACDAGVLAGRRASGRSGKYETDEKKKANRMFNANFEPAKLSVTQSNFTTRRETNEDISGAATAILPTMIMGVFAYDKFNLSVDCRAELQISNTDVMFVLDTTGSMAGAPLEGLKNAVRDFHSTMASSVVAPETRIRYGFVPYAHTVNAKYLVQQNQIPASYFGSSAVYSTREAVFDTEDHIGTGTKIYGSTESKSSSESECTGSGVEWSTDYGKKTISGAAPNSFLTFYEKETYTPIFLGYGTCKRRKVTQPARRVYRFSRYVDHETPINTTGVASSQTIALGYASSDSWVATPGTYDAREMGAFNSTNSSGLTKFNSTWTGCIMERATVRGTDWNPIPVAARDLDVVSAPQSGVPDSYWAPLWTEVMYRRKQSNYAMNAGCPQTMRAFQPAEMTSTTAPRWVEDFLNSLVATGGTYHDIGMIWGARLASRRGIMSANVNDEPHRSSTRHIIFMTDGEATSYGAVATAYGLEFLANRVAAPNTDDTTLTTIHRSRFRAACDAAKNEDLVIWMVAFGTTISDDMRYCATGDRVFYAADTTQLRAQFRSIASQIANLRLGD